MDSDWQNKLPNPWGTVTMTAALRITLNIDDVSITSRSHTHPSHSNLSSINLVSIFRCSSSPCNLVYVRRVDFLVLVFSLSSHRHSYIGLLFTSLYRFIINWKKQGHYTDVFSLVLVLSLTINKQGFGI